MKHPVQDNELFYGGEWFGAICALMLAASAVGFFYILWGFVVGL